MSKPIAGMSEETYTLSQFILDEFKGERQELTYIMNAVSVAAKIIAQTVQQAGVKPLKDFTAGIFRGTQKEGRHYTKMDDLAADVLVNALKYSQQVGMIFIDGHEDPISYPSEPGAPPKKYAFVTDPLDGSNNIDCNIAIGTTFGIYKAAKQAASIDDILAPGSNMAVAGYVLYGATTTLMLTTGQGSGAHMFAVDPDYGEFTMVRRNVKIPDPARQVYSINSGNSEVWDRPTREFIRWTKLQEAPYSARYVGSMVSDVHRTILMGGIFMYPADKRQPSGKLRLLSEIFPLSLLMEEAGGQSTTGLSRCLDVQPKDVHEKSAVFMGCKRDVHQIEVFYSYFGAVYEDTFVNSNQDPLPGVNSGAASADASEALKRRKY